MKFSLKTLLKEYSEGIIKNHVLGIYQSNILSFKIKDDLLIPVKQLTCLFTFKNIILNSIIYSFK